MASNTLRVVEQTGGHCQLTDRPPSSDVFAPTEIIYSWVFNEFPSFVAEDSRRFISQDTGNLYISKVQPSDVGIYICLVKNTVTNARVLSPPTPLTLKTDGEMNLTAFIKGKRHGLRFKHMTACALPAVVCR